MTFEELVSDLNDFCRQVNNVDKELDHCLRLTGVVQNDSSILNNYTNIKECLRQEETPLEFFAM